MTNPQTIEPAIATRSRPISSRSTSGSAESTDSSETTKINQADRQETARQVFKKLAREYNKSKYPSEEDLGKLNSFSDVIDEDFFLRCSADVGFPTGIEFGYGRVIFEQFAEPPHDDLVNAFNQAFDNSVNPGVYPDTPFHSAGTANINLPGYGEKQPDSQFRPRDQIPPGPFSPFFTQPNTNKLWPTVVLEVARTQTQPDLITLMKLYLSSRTQVNVFVGVKIYNDTTTRTIPTRWWMGVFVRDINPTQPTLANPGPLPAPGPICIGQLSHPHHDLLTMQQNIVWNINLNTIFHPIQLPPNPPHAPPGFVYPPNGLQINVDQFRRVVLESML